MAHCMLVPSTSRVTAWPRDRDEQFAPVFECLSPAQAADVVEIEAGAGEDEDEGDEEDEDAEDEGEDAAAEEEEERRAESESCGGWGSSRVLLGSCSAGPGGGGAVGRVTESRCLGRNVARLIEGGAGGAGGGSAPTGSAAGPVMCAFGRRGRGRSMTCRPSKPTAMVRS